MKNRLPAGEPLVGLEIGTTKVVLMVAEPRDDHGLTVRALATHPAVGLRKGQVVDYESALTCVREALRELEQRQPLPRNRLWLALSGPHIRTSRNRGHAPVLSPRGEITEEDVRQVKRVAAAMPLPQDREVIHTFFGRYLIDDEHVVLRPTGMEGARLSVDVLALHGSHSHFRNLAKLARDLGLECTGTVFSGSASAMAVLRPEQKQGGAVLIDLGGGTTDYVAYADGTIAAAGVLGVGGEHVTNDLTQAFNLTQREAERLKCEHGSAMPERTTKAVVLPSEFGGRERTVPLASLRAVVHARMEETFGLLKSRLDADGILNHVGAGILLTGGGAMLRDVTVLAERVFGKPCVMAAARGLHGDGMASRPDLATVAGLIRCGLRSAAEPERRSAVMEWFRTLWNAEDRGRPEDDLYG